MDSLDYIKNHIRLLAIGVNGIQKILDKKIKDDEDLLKVDYLLNWISTLTDEAYKKINEK